MLAACKTPQHEPADSSTSSEAERPARREVAVTFDDLPGVAMLQSQRCNPKAFAELNATLVQKLREHRVPAIGFVVERNVCEGQEAALPGLLSMWLDAGLELGNHSFSHFDLNDTPLARYQADVIRGERVTKELLRQRGKRLVYFRHPFLHAGKDLATKRSFERFLAARGYTVAPVTIDNQEWVFAEVYARAKDNGDTATATRVGNAYITYMDGIFAFYEKWSVAVVGYEVKQVLLLHANPLNADYFDELVGMMRMRGYAFITLDRALEDPAYALPDTYAGPGGSSWLHRWALTKGMTLEEEPREPAFINELYTGYIRSSPR